SEPTAAASATTSALRQLLAPYRKAGLAAARSSSTGTGVSQTRRAAVRSAAMRRSSRRLATDSPVVTCGLPPATRVTSLPPRPQRIQSGAGSIIEGQRRSTMAVVCPERRSEEHTSELQSRENLVCRLLLEKKKDKHSPPR